MRVVATFDTTSPIEYRIVRTRGTVIPADLSVERGRLLGEDGETRVSLNDNERAMMLKWSLYS